MSAWLSLDELAEQGHIVDEWRRWQQGGCGTYALALLQSYPHLRLGALVTDEGAIDHFVVHDDQWAYDSAGRHRLPYLGVQPSEPFAQLLLDQDPEDHDLDAYTPDIPDAVAHARRHRIHPQEAA